MNDFSYNAVLLKKDLLETSRRRRNRFSGDAYEKVAQMYQNNEQNKIFVWKNCIFEMENITQLSKFNFKVGGYSDVPSAGGCALPALRDWRQRILIPVVASERERLCVPCFCGVISPTLTHTLSKNFRFLCKCFREFKIRSGCIF